MHDSKPTLHLKSPFKTVPESLKIVRSSLRDEERALMKARKREEDKALRTLIMMLSKRFPQCFNYKEPKPLKIGIHHDILEAIGETLAPRPRLIRALTYYTQSLAYYQAVIKNIYRYNLQGERDQPLTHEEKRYSTETLQRLELKLQMIKGSGFKPKTNRLFPKHAHSNRPNHFKNRKRLATLPSARVG